MNDDPKEKTPVPRQVHRDIRSGTDDTWTPPPLPHWPDQRKRYTLHAKIEQARRKAVDMDVVYLLDELTKLLQCVSMASRGVIEQAKDVDKDATINTATETPEPPDATENISVAGGATKKGPGRPASGKALSATERSREHRRRQAEKIIKDKE